MTDVTQILAAVEQGDPNAADRLLPLVYDELRRLAAQKMAQERPGQTLQATGLVHEAFLRLVGSSREHGWENRSHFFAAAGEAMRRILVERARHKKTLKRGGHAMRVDLDQIAAADEEHSDAVLAVDEALNELETHDPQAAALVKLRFYGGFKHQEAAEALGISRRAADRLWALSRAWLFQRINQD